MTRLIIYEKSTPIEVKCGEESKWICNCGLSTNLPFCSGAHTQCEGEEEGKLYKYEDGKRIEVKDF